MRFKTLLLLFTICFTLNTVSSLVYSQNKERGIWVWSNTESIIEDYIQNDHFVNTWENFISFCEAPHGNPDARVTNIYMSAYSYMRFQSENMRQFLADMNSRGFKVYVVLADPYFIIHYNLFHGMIDHIILFQENSKPNERFAGIMLDIEPYQFTGTPLDFEDSEDFQQIWDAYIDEILTYCKTKVDAYNAANSPSISFSDAVAWWYDIPDDWDGDSTDEILMNDILPLVSFYTVMAYKDTLYENDGIVPITSGEIDACEIQGIECVIGVETMPLDDERLTFYEEGHYELEEILNDIYNPDNESGEYFDNESFGGFSIHHYANNAISEEGYQNLGPTVDDHAPIITITSPNGVEVEGISFSNDFTVSWESKIPDNKNYDVEISYKFQSELDNDSIAWTVIDTDTNISNSITSSSSTFHVNGEYTTSTDRIIIKAEISYSSPEDPLTTSDRTNFGIGINEVPDLTSWSDTIPIEYPGYPQGMKVIFDNDSVFHAAYYRYYDRNYDPGVYYARSEDQGTSWSHVNLTPNNYTYDGDYIQSTWPRRPVISKYNNVIAIAWVEDTIQDNDGFTDRVICLQINDGYGNSDNWLNNKIDVITQSSDIVSNVDVHVDSNGDIHLVWEAYYDGSDLSRIEYVKYSYNSSSEQWTAGSIEVVSQNSSEYYFLRTPSVTTSAYGIHAIWGEYRTEGTVYSLGNYAVNEHFNSYPETTPINWSHSISGFNWEVYGTGAVSSAIIEDPDNGANKFIRIKEDLSGSSNGFGVAQRNNFSPTINLMISEISFKIRTNLSTPVSAKITAEIITDAIESPGFYLTFSLPVAEYYDIPDNDSGNWTTLTFPAEDLTYSEATWAHPNLTNIRKVQIRFASGTYNSLSNAEIDIDDFEVIETETTSYDPAMIIVSNTKSGSWGTEKEISIHEYTVEQLFSGASTDTIVNYPVYFPKIASLGDYVYSTWQFTTLGSPDNDSLEEFSSVYFSKLDVSSSSNDWDNETLLSSSGYAPALSVWNNSGTPTVQIVYSSNFDEYIPNEAHTGNLSYIESVNQGSSWSTAINIVQGSGTATGVRRPYTNNSFSGIRGWHFMSYPFIFTDENGISTCNWINGDLEEYCKIRGSVLLNVAYPPFADLSDNDGFVIKWRPPDTSYAPTGYKLRRIPDNNFSLAYDLNSGNTIDALSYYDNDGITAGTHYRYQISYLVDSISSIWTTLSNAIKEDDFLLLDDFELINDNDTYTGNTYSFFDAYKPITAEITTDDYISGSYSMKITYTDNDSSLIKGAVATIEFPTIMDFSSYGSIDLKLKFVSGVERKIKVTVEEFSSEQRFTIGSSIMPVDDGEWHSYNLYLDQVEPENTGTTLDLNDIKKLNFVTWTEDVDGNSVPDEGTSGSITYYVDDIKLNGSKRGDPILIVSPTSITVAEAISNPGFVSGKMISEDLTPVTIEFGNAPEPWSIRVYTPSEIYDNEGTPYILRKDGLVRYDNDSDTLYSQYNMPIKVWCKNYGPPGFLDNDGNIVNSEYALHGYPPIDNDYFFRGYDFDNDGEISNLLYPIPGVRDFIEGYGPGQYPFDLDGDGFTPGDNFFYETYNRDYIGEEPVWLFVPVYKHPTIPMDENAIVMDPEDEDTWRVITDSYKGAGNHILELYFAVFIGEEQIMYGRHENAYGNYSGIIIVDFTYN